MRDIAKIAIKSTRSDLGKNSDEIYDVGSGHAISCNDVAEYVLKKTKELKMI